jgi:hypothetical protein
MNDRLREGHCTVLTLEHLLIINGLLNLKTLMELTTAPLLLMTSCEIIQIINDESKGILDINLNSVFSIPKCFDICRI